MVLMLVFPLCFTDINYMMLWCLVMDYMNTFSCAMVDTVWYIVVPLIWGVNGRDFLALVVSLI